MLKLDEKYARMTVVNEARNSEKMREREAPKANPEAKESKKIDVAGAAKVMTEAANISSEVSDVMGDHIEGAESAEGFSEGKGNKDSKQSTAKAKQKKDDQSVKDIKAHIHKTIPVKQMQKEVAQEIRKEIRREERKVLMAYVGLKKYHPSRLAEIIAKIRQLKDLIASLVLVTKEVLTGLYLKWVRKEV